MDLSPAPHTSRTWRMWRWQCLPWWARDSIYMEMGLVSGVSTRRREGLLVLTTADLDAVSGGLLPGHGTWCPFGSSRFLQGEGWRRPLLLCKRTNFPCVSPLPVYRTRKRFSQGFGFRYLGSGRTPAHPASRNMGYGTSALPSTSD